ncbi:DgyrCDS5139 [Dimorphilus gyrociliatus]|uniref:DgyrCDS5139 n=1 Tax=Dimorphilus gyrociliatus TaxID=2664684 RepID=A0A7I8VLL9_9ANNE|nr:DgyrCDS5139 [Dimorphilus gyrociliatus]
MKKTEFIVTEELIPTRDVSFIMPQEPNTGSSPPLLSTSLHSLKKKWWHGALEHIPQHLAVCDRGASTLESIPELANECKSNETETDSSSSPNLLLRTAQKRLLRRRSSLKDQDELAKLKQLANKLQLATRRGSFGLWQERYLDALNKSVGSLTDVEEWNEERREKINRDLAWLRKELQSYEENEYLIEEALEGLEGEDGLGLVDVPRAEFSPILRDTGVTKWHLLDQRRFSVL